MHPVRIGSRITPQPLTRNVKRNGEWGLEKRKKNSDELTLNIQERMLSRIWGEVRIGSSITTKPRTLNQEPQAERGVGSRKAEEELRRAD